MNKKEIIEFTDINGKKVKGCGFGEPVKCQDITIKEFKPFPVEATDLDLDNEIADTIHYLARINVLGKEIERLNNIINKIIEFLQREQIEKGEYCDFLIENKQIKVQDVLDKLQELKGDGSND